jgi:BASS family bile acid:Na+ symporter
VSLRSFVQQQEQFFTRAFGPLILGFAIAGYVLPGAFSWVFQPSPVAHQVSSLNVILMGIMLSMGLTLTANDLRQIVKRKREVAIGFVAQFAIMSTLGFAVAELLGLSEGATIGLVLVGCCPGGTASNVITYFAKGDVGLSVAMTTVSTLAAPFLTPLLVYLLLQKSVPMDAPAMFLSIAQVVLVPVVLGAVLRWGAERFVGLLMPFIPALSTIGIGLIVAAVVGANQKNILSSGLQVGGAVLLHNGLGLLLGYVAAKLLLVPERSARTISIEVGMQNSGLAASLAKTHFAAYPGAALPAALFSVCHNLTGALLAWWWARRPADN